MKYVQLTNDNGIVTIRVDQAESGSFINRKAIEELSEVVGGLFRDKSAQVVILTGYADKFMDGPDPQELLGLSPLEARELTMQVKDLFWTLATLPQVTIAAINGPASAIGCEASVCCDMRIASEKAIFVHPETGMGLLPGYGGTQRLTRLIGPGYAKEMIFTGKVVDAAEAYRIGLVNQVVPAEELDKICHETAERIMKNGHYANNLAKHAINIGMEVDLDSAISLEGDLYALLFSCADHDEGLRAKIEGRTAALRDF